MLPFGLLAIATSGVLTSEVPVDIRVADVNDHDPVFSQPLYTATVKEDVSIGQKILQGKLVSNCWLRMVVIIGLIHSISKASIDCKRNGFVFSVGQGSRQRQKCGHPILR